MPQECGYDKHARQPNHWAKRIAASSTNTTNKGLMNIVLTMAGKYNRFKLFGSKVPKYLLPLGNGTILSEIIKQFKLSTDKAKIYLIANRDDQIFYPIVRSIISNNSVPDSNLMYIDDTTSQLETALYASELISDNDKNPVAIANIDTITLNRNSWFKQLEKLESTSGLVDTFNGNSNEYSYARLGKDNKILEIIDRNIISKYACSGLYGFGSYVFMRQIATGVLRKNGNAGFTELYKEYINMGLAVFSLHESKIGQTLVLGSPEEYVINIHKFQ
jgi:dTDP-glucose pyrophosphorylase